MKKIILIGIVLLPCLVHASTNCKVEEYADHYDATCIGDEKSVPAPMQQSVTAPVTIEQTVSTPVTIEQTVSTPAPTQQAVTASSDVSSAPVPAAMQVAANAKPDASPAPLIHRQGRPPKSVMDEARAMRARVIQEQLQQ